MYMFPIPHPLSTYEIIQFLISFNFGNSHSIISFDFSLLNNSRNRRRRSKRQKQFSNMSTVTTRSTCYLGLFLFLLILPIARTTRIATSNHAVATTASNNDVVIAIGISNDLFTYKRYIGSLRHSGYTGLIILARPKHPSDNSSSDNDQSTSIRIEKYLQQNNVIIKYIEATTNCHNHVLPLSDENEQLSKIKNNKHHCVKPYTDLKLSWSGYALARDWLHDECILQQKCSTSSDGGGRVLLSPLHHVYFQSNPFTDISVANDNKSITKPFLYLFESHPSKTINDNHALLQCKKFFWDVPIMSSIVFSDVTSMTFYLEDVIKEAYKWMSRSECYLSNSGIAIHNFLFYNGMIRPNGSDGNSNGVFRYRQGIVNSVDIIGKYYREYIWNESDGEKDWAQVSIFLQKEKHVDEFGYFLNADGTRSAIILHFEAFGLPLQQWLLDQRIVVDDVVAVKETMNGSDNPVKNLFFYLSLESSTYYNDVSMLRKRHVMGKLQSKINI